MQLLPPSRRAQHRRSRRARARRRGAQALVRYRFGLGTADFLLCARCGVYVACVIDGAFATVNVRALAEASRFTQAPRPNDWSGESADERRARRRATWTPASVEERP